MDRAMRLGFLAVDNVLFPGMRLKVALGNGQQHTIEESLEANGLCAVLYQGKASAGVQSAAIGVLARIVDVERTPGQSTSKCLLLGICRCRIGSGVSAEDAENRVTIDLLRDTPVESCKDLAAEVTAVFASYVASLLRLAKRDRSDLVLPTEPNALSYVVAACAQIGNPLRQQLLEEVSAEKRLLAEREILERERALMQQQMVPDDSEVVLVRHLSA